jgi:acylphosphatase
MTEKSDEDYSVLFPADPAEMPEAEGKQAAVHGYNTYGVRVTGRVQGVNFRHFVKSAADGLQIRGWVRNEPDGSVRAVLQIELLLEQLHVGPPAAQVDEVYVEQLADEPEHSEFAIRR